MGKYILHFRQSAGESAGTPCVGTANTPDAACARGLGLGTEAELTVSPPERSRLHSQPRRTERGSWAEAGFGKETLPFKSFIGILMIPGGKAFGS